MPDDNEPTVLQNCMVLQTLGLQMQVTMPSTFIMPSAYSYVPTQVVYSTADTHAKLVRDTQRDPEGSSIGIE